MNDPVDISKIKDPMVLDSYNTLLRAAELARETAIQTNTGIVISRDGKITHISADELREEAKTKAQNCSN